MQNRGGGRGSSPGGHCQVGGPSVPGDGSGDEKEEAGGFVLEMDSKGGPLVRRGVRDGEGARIVRGVEWRRRRRGRENLPSSGMRGRDRVGGYGCDDCEMKRTENDGSCVGKAGRRRSRRRTWRKEMAGKTDWWLL